MAGGSSQSPDEDEEVDAAGSLMYLYRVCVERYGWSLNDIEETCLETLIDFLLAKEKQDKNSKVIDGKVYRRTQSVPDWL